MKTILANSGSQTDMLEMRLDYLESACLEEVLALLPDSPKPLIATLRPRRHGGRYEGPEGERLSWLKRCGRAGAAFIDLEHDVADESVDTFRGEAAALIRSYHDFSRTPPDLPAIYEQLASRPTDVVKIATQVRGVSDLRALARLRDLPGTKVLIGMGDSGVATRILAGRFGSAFCFASLGRGRESAAGQISVAELSSRYRIKSIGPSTRVYGVLGWPVAHSLSPVVHNAAFAAEGMDAVYTPLASESLEGLKECCAELGFSGLSVTLPHKQAVAALCDRLDSAAEAMGAVNTVLIENGRWRGFNTDAGGFIRPLRSRFGPQGLPATVLGCGGAARAVVAALAADGWRITIASRNEARGRELARAFGGRWRPWAEYYQEPARLLVNATPVGMAPESDASPCDLSRLSWDARTPLCVYDLVYNPLETALLRQARDLGCSTIDGLEMFLGQAAEQFRLWTGRAMPLDVARGAAVSNLTEK